ncbi:MAG: hypothetical protein ACRCTP_17900 [Aeromonas popoffii]|uniref:hypothetical protein n=1 Tax=Aeromonas popoffii TaxID=70856 RepID=UPI003F37BEA3
MINMTALQELLAAQGITPRIERPDIWTEVDLLQGLTTNWPPKPQHGEQTLAIDVDEMGVPVAIFIPREV